MSADALAPTDVARGARAGLFARAASWVGERAREGVVATIARAGVEGLVVEGARLTRGRLAARRVAFSVAGRSIELDDIDVGIVPAAPLGAFAFDGEGRAAGATVGVRGRLVVDGGRIVIASLRVRAPALSAAQIERLAGSRPRWLPPGVVLDVAIERDARGALRGAIEVRGDGTRIGIELARDPRGDLSGTRVVGVIATRDALAIGWFSGDLAPRPTGALEVDLRLRGDLPSLGVDGTVAAERVELARASLPDGAPMILEGGRVVIDADRRRLAYRDLEVRADGARIRARGVLRFGRTTAPSLASPRAVIDVEPVSLAWIERAAALVAPRSGLAIPGWLRAPEDLRVRGEIALFGAGIVSATIAARTARSSIEAWIAPGDDLARSSARARIDVEEAIAAAGDRVPASLRASGVIDVDATLVERAGKLAARLTLASDRLVGPRDVTIEDLRATLSVSRGKLAWTIADARILGGRVAGEGSLAFDPRALVALDASLELDGLRVERAPVATIGETLRGALGGVLHVRRGARDEPIHARAELRVDDPEYVGVRAIADRLVALGLAPLAPRGDGPLTLEARWDGVRLAIDRAEARLRGARLEASGAIARTGELSGGATIEVAPAYLGRSVYFALATLGVPLVVPIDFGGSARRPRVHVRASNAAHALADGAFERIVRELRAAFTRSTDLRGRRAE